MSCNSCPKLNFHEIQTWRSRSTIFGHIYAVKLKLGAGCDQGDE